MASNVEWVVRWLVVEAHARAPGTPTMHRRLQKAFADGKAAVTFVMTGLDEVHRRSAQLHSRGDRPINFEVIKQTYGSYKEAAN
jgi:hypothetical protein